MHPASRTPPFARIALMITGLAALACVPAVAQDAEEPARTVTIRTTQGSGEVRLDVLLADGEPLTLTADLVEIAEGPDGITATLQVDAEGRVQLCPPEPEKPSVMIGITSEPLPEALAAQLRLGPADAVLIAEVSEGMPAQQAGVRRFDIITAVNGHSPVTQESLRACVEASSPGDKITLSLLRAGSPVQCEVAVGPYVALAFEHTRSLIDASRTLSYYAESRLGNIEVSRAWTDLAISGRVAEVNPYVVELVLDADQPAADSPQARLRAELAAIKEKLAAIEQILDELENAQP